jgi:hypothetical protein
MIQIEGEPNWRLLGRLQDLADEQGARFIVAYDANTRIWSISIVRSRAPEEVGCVHADFGIAASLAASTLEATR